ncbi:single-strand selective monofunctional uracil DNA glycosylase [Drosophila tropicalis]|uniref:single-strand selective monofunctional uracil DNA glycosylase n=1 Tax=Drosophila tropicalis TaxID=46794 RepID=UPI0035AB8377
MLKRKLQQQEAAASKVPLIPQEPAPNGGLTTSALFAKPLWQEFYEIEQGLNVELQQLNIPPNIAFVYNPVEYAASMHCDYLRRFLTGPSKKVMFIGMNPGPNGMGQTGIPFGNVRTVRDLMHISGIVEQPPAVHPKRPVRGLDCSIEEPSGVRLWELFQSLAGGNLETFSQLCFVHNFCPLAFFDAAGKNITPSELKGDYKKEIGTCCLRALEKQLLLVKPDYVVAVGNYVYTLLKRSKYCQTARLVVCLPHPSPRSVNNTNWPEKANDFLELHNLIRFMRNEAV